MSKTFRDGILAAARILEMTAEDFEHTIPRLEVELARARANNTNAVEWLSVDLESVKSKARLLRGQAKIISELKG